MTFKKISSLAVAAILLAGVGITVAQDAFVAPATPEAAVAARKALMKQDGGLLRSAGNLTGAEAEAAMTTLQANYSHIPLLFPEGSIVADSEALPIIWEKWADFAAIAKTGEDAATAGLAAAKAGDAAGYAAALKTIGGTCGTCHQTFRGQ